MATEHPDRLPSGFQYAGIAAGIKSSGKPDLALIVSQKPTVAAAVLTTNVIHACSIDWCRQVFPAAQFRAVLVNSGNANACTGETGLKNHRQICEILSGLLDCEPQQVTLLSTGIIGQQLPMPVLQSGLPQVFSQLEGGPVAFQNAARAITTTDNAPKSACHSWTFGQQTYTIAVMAKGAGMIGPNMATMLGIAVTDFPLSQQQAQDALRRSVQQSFNAISVEGHMSTNDAVILMTSEGRSADTAPDGEALEIFQQALDQVMLDCAKMIPADGEGATHLVCIKVKGCASRGDAERIARTIAGSALVKTAVYGNDPNWGRMVSAAGHAGVAFSPQSVSLSINGHPVFASGTPVDFDETQVSRSMAGQFQTDLELTLEEGQQSTTHWTSDLTVDYVRFNSDYST